MHASRRMGPARPRSPFETPAAKTLPAPQGEGGRPGAGTLPEMTDAVTRVSHLPDADVPPRANLDPKWFLIGAAVALTAWLALVPLVFLIWQSFLTPQTTARPSVFTLD